MVKPQYSRHTAPFGVLHRAEQVHNPRQEREDLNATATDLAQELHIDASANGNDIDNRKLRGDESGGIFRERDAGQENHWRVEP